MRSDGALLAYADHRPRAHLAPAHPIEALSTIDIPDEHDDIDGIEVIDIRAGDRSTPFEHRVEPVSKTTKAIKFLDDHPGVQISPAAIRRIAFGAVEPDLLAGTRLERHRVETGWLTVITYRACTLMLSPAIENDRLLDEAHYAADPDTSAHRARHRRHPRLCRRHGRPP